MRYSFLAAMLATAASMAGCAAHPDPIIDMMGVNEAQLARDWEECESYAEQVRIEQGVARGAATGAIIGAATGAISGRVTTKNTFHGRAPRSSAASSSDGSRRTRRDCTITAT